MTLQPTTHANKVKLDVKIISENDDMIISCKTSKISERISRLLTGPSVLIRIHLLISPCLSQTLRLISHASNRLLFCQSLHFPQYQRQHENQSKRLQQVISCKS